MTARITILCENSVSRPGTLIGEHGFSALIETHESSHLFDTGQGFGLINNAQEIGRDLQKISSIILSHGHSDHTGGLPILLDELNCSVPVFAHPDLFAERYWKSEFELRSIGIPWQRAEMEERGAIFHLSPDFLQISENLYCSGEVPRLTPFEKGDVHLVVPCGEGEYSQDPIRDDLSLAVKSKEGLVILLGCAHAGVINIIDHFIKMTGEERIFALIGGTHLGPASEENFQSTLSTLKNYRITKLGLSHCTGLNRSSQFFHEFPGHCFFAAAGTVLEFN